MPRYINADELKADHFVASTTANTTNYLYVSLSQIENAQTANVRENVHAHWVYKALEGFPEITFPVCSNCDEDAIDYVESNFCPHCGAVMDERREG